MPDRRALMLAAIEVLLDAALVRGWDARVSALTADDWSGFEITVWCRAQGITRATKRRVSPHAPVDAWRWEAERVVKDLDAAMETSDG